MNTISMTSTKPYLMRAIFEWAEDNGFTSQVLVNAEADGVEVPTAHVVDGQIVLNISSSAVQLHVMDNEFLSFSARFSGVEENIHLPIHSILAIFARENSQGIFFEDVDDDDFDPEPESLMQEAKKTAPTKIKPKRDAGHLKVIK